jgi:hypothetical protein
LNQIEHIVEPTKLLLAWQQPSLTGDRRRWAVGELVKADSGLELRYYPESHPDVIEARKLGYKGYPAFSLTMLVHRSGVLEAFLRRLPPRTRADFSEYRRYFRLPGDSSISDMALLGYSEAKLPSDGFSLVHPFEEIPAKFELLHEVAGFRHYIDQVPPLPVGARVDFELEPTNTYDPNAVKITYQGHLLGYVNRLQAPIFYQWLRSRTISAVIEKTNGQPDRPRLFVFVKVSDRSDQQAA